MIDILNRIEFYYHEFLKSLPKLVLAILIVVMGILIANWITSIFQKRISKKSHDPLMSKFLSKALKILLIIFVMMIALNIAGLNSVVTAIIAAAGASAIVLGFAFKDIAENFLAGVILAFNRPFHIDDTVQIENTFGKIKSMEFRYTKITTFDGRNVYIPNSDVLTKPVINFTEDGFYRVEFVVGIAYENDIEKAKQIIVNCFNSDDQIVKDDMHANFVVEDELASSTVNLKVLFWVTTEDFRKKTLEIRGNLIRNVKTDLEAAGFNLPSEIRELKFYDASKSFQVNSEKN